MNPFAIIIIAVVAVCFLVWFSDRNQKIKNARSENRRERIHLLIQKLKKGNSFDGISESEEIRQDFYSQIIDEMEL